MKDKEKASELREWTARACHVIIIPSSMIIEVKLKFRWVLVSAVSFGP